MCCEGRVGLPTFGGLRPNREVRINASALRFGVALVLLASLESLAETLSSSQAPARAATYRPGPKDVVQPAGLPEIGKWMVSPDLTPADWLGAKYAGKSLKEPINVIIVDKAAKSAAEARARLAAACAKADYPSRTGHSGGYHGYIAGGLYPQLPSEADQAFSNGLFLFNNNHGRVFGPYPFDGGYLFVVAMSRERVAPLASVKHQYASFNQARDDFAGSLDRATNYRTTGFVGLENAIVGDLEVTTGDHDGVAVLITATR